MSIAHLLRTVLVSCALGAALCLATPHIDLSETHKRFEPGYMGYDFETSLSIHEWSRVGALVQLYCYSG